MPSHTPLPTDQVAAMDDQAVATLASARLASLPPDALIGLHLRPTTIEQAASARVTCLLVDLAAELSHPACPDCAAVFPVALTCASEHGALIARLHNLTDRAGRRLARILAVGSTSTWD
jgi:hypothetical protein